MQLDVLPGAYAIWHLRPGSDWRAPTTRVGEIAAVAVTDDEISILGPERAAPDNDVEVGFRVLRVHGSLDFGLVGVIADITGVLAAARVSVFVLSTYNTDYLAIRDRDLASATTALVAGGFEVESGR